MSQRTVILACLVVLGLAIVTVVLNNFRWSYYNEGLHCVDKWMGRVFRTNSENAPIPVLDTAKYVFGISGAVGLLGVLMSLAVGQKSTRQD
jgi:hypothetical protein